jgi:hypothetical protein
LEADLFVGGDNIQASRPKPVDLLGDVGDRPGLQSNQDVEHFGEVDGAYSRAIDCASKQPLDLCGGGLAGKCGDDRLRVEERQRTLPFRRSAAASASRSSARISSLVGARPASEPMAAPIGSDGIGRMTSAFPWSSTDTRWVPQRCLISAGMET